MKKKNILIAGIAAAVLAAGATAFAAGGAKGYDGFLGRMGCRIRGNEPGQAGSCCTGGTYGASSGSLTDGQTETAVVADGIQEITTGLESYSYPSFIVKKGIPVRWTITADEESLNACNNAIIIPGLDIMKRLSAGDNVIEFTPAETGTIPYSCWMGMITAEIIVVE